MSSFCHILLATNNQGRIIQCAQEVPPHGKRENCYWLIDWARFNVPPNTLWVIMGTTFTGHMTKPTVSKHWRKPVGLSDKAWISPAPLHHITIIQLQATASMHGVRVPVWQTKSAGPVRTAHMSVLLTVNIVSHNPARSSSDNIPS